MVSVFHNPSYQTTYPKLSVLIPFFHDDPSALVDALSFQTEQSSVEIILVDDGTGDAHLTRNLQTLISQQTLAISLVTFEGNKGRSAARNHLQNVARAEWLLFLDADMRPTSTQFLENYLKVINDNKADVFFGGFTVERKSVNKAGELHRALSEVSDCLPLAERKAAGPQFVASSNLCLRKSVITEHPFDDAFVGWGWEDSDWAARISTSYRLEHIDNPALHLGLESTETLLRRFQTSGQNYRRFIEKHPDLAKTLTLYKLSRSLGKIPGQKFMRPFLRAIVKSPSPMKARLVALKLWRASWYAEALS